MRSQYTYFVISAEKPIQGYLSGDEFAFGDRYISVAGRLGDPGKYLEDMALCSTILFPSLQLPISDYGGTDSATYFYLQK